MRFNQRCFHTILRMVFIFIAVLGVIGESALYFSELNENKLFSSVLIDCEDSFSEELEDEDEDYHHLIFLESIKQFQLPCHESRQVSFFENEIKSWLLPYGRQLCIAYKCLKWFLLF